MFLRLRRNIVQSAGSVANRALGKSCCIALLPTLYSEFVPSTRNAAESLVADSTRQHGRPPVHQLHAMPAKASEPFPFPVAVEKCSLVEVVEVPDLQPAESQMNNEAETGDRQNSSGPTDVAAPGTADVEGRGKSRAGPAPREKAEPTPSKPKPHSDSPAPSPEESPSTQKYFQCGACQKVFRLMDAAQHHVQSRHQGNAEINVVSAPARSLQTPAVKQQPTSGMAVVTQNAKRPSFPRPPKRRPVPEEQLMGRAEAAGIIEVAFPELSSRYPRGPCTPRFGAGSARFPPPAPFVVDLAGRAMHGTVPGSHSARVALVEVDAHLPDGNSAAPTSSSINKMVVLGVVRERVADPLALFAQLIVATYDDEIEMQHVISVTRPSDRDVERIGTITLGSLVLAEGRLSPIQEIDVETGVQHQKPLLRVRPTHIHVVGAPA